MNNCMRICKRGQRNFCKGMLKGSHVNGPSNAPFPEELWSAILLSSIFLPKRAFRGSFMQYISLAGRACSLFVPDRKIPAGGFPLVLSNDGDMPAANFDALFSRKTPIGFVFWQCLRWIETASIPLESACSFPKNSMFYGRRRGILAFFDRETST